MKKIHLQVCSSSKKGHQSNFQTPTKRYTPQRLSWHLKRGHFKRKGLSSNHYFSGDMLVSGGVCCFCSTGTRLLLKNSHPFHISQAWCMGERDRATSCEGTSVLGWSFIMSGDVAPRRAWKDPEGCCFLLKIWDSGLLTKKWGKSWVVAEKTPIISAEAEQTSQTSIVDDMMIFILLL